MSENNNGNAPAENFDATYRFRCFDTLKKRAARVAAKRGHGDKSDIAREGVIKLVEAEEKRLGLPPLEAPSKLEEAVA